MTVLDLDAIEARLGHANGFGLDEAVARHYRADVPELVAEVRRLRSALADELGKAIVHGEGFADMETRAELFNDGYEAAIGQGLADDPTRAEEWLAEHDQKLRAALAERIQLMAAAERESGRQAAHRAIGLETAAQVVAGMREI